MSRIGKVPITIPKGVTVVVKDGAVSVKGPKGTLERRIPPHAEVDVKESEILISPFQNDSRYSSFQGLTRSLIANMVNGVHTGFKKDMSIIGVGYKVALQGKALVFSLGFSHPVNFPLPQGIDAEIGDKGLSFSILGADKELVGQTCATIRSFRSPEPYKGKGVRYSNETVRIKAGKAGAK